jgi:YidC/Oxa1 family membrane protein insertase
MKMSRLTPRLKVIQEKYANDPQKQNQAMQELYRSEGVSMGGGCLWSLLPLLILFPLYDVVREPMVYMLHISKDNANTIVEIIKEAGYLEGINQAYSKMIAAEFIPNVLPQIEEAGITLSAAAQKGIDFDFLGLDMSGTPNWHFWEAAFWAGKWATIGAALLPVISAGTQVMTMMVSMKLNNSLITNEKGIRDKEAAKDSQVNQTTKTMMWVGPIMSLVIGYGFPCALSIYWIIQGFMSLIIDVILTYKYHKIYDAEDAERLAKLLEEELAAQEKERIRAERRAANPDGQTQNTSKKKLQKQQQAEADAAKAAAAKEYAMKRGTYVEEDEENKPLSGIADRPFCKGRAYDPDRYNTTEE